MNITPVNTRRIYQYIIEQFVELIKQGKLKVGDKLPPERTLAEMFNVSRASIREAFSAMEIIGLIEVRPGEGSFITNLNIAPFINAITPLFIKNENMEEELLEFRKMIELEAIKLVCMRSDNGSLFLLEEPIKLMEEAIDKNDVNMGVEADIKFHKAIFSLTDNFVLIKAAECVSFIFESSVRFNRSKILKDSANTKVLYNQHIQIYQAIKNKDVQLAQEIMNKHLNFVKEIA
ncbi:FadR/GntR family transcriptional regulator [Petroclostridium sp. X23]|uniref:FadR/GntR family transcriptional regulator n=1 Tax=Petroclostridium sp. X23 TaxID=3045146 RepID=UPI0024ADD432|nr:FadR/GntR family transcriptional regulator [Petroclostridium sp. X23]WHH58035.1 FadR/GntR family transcriptional regulator [Petroclostridium sp. X23]